MKSMSTLKASCHPPVGNSITIGRVSHGHQGSATSCPWGLPAVTTSLSKLETEDFFFSQARKLGKAGVEAANHLVRTDMISQVLSSFPGRHFWQFQKVLLCFSPSLLTMLTEGCLLSALLPGPECLIDKLRCAFGGFKQSFKINKIIIISFHLPIH